MKPAFALLFFALSGTAFAQLPYPGARNPNEPGYTPPGVHDSGASREPIGLGTAYRGQVESIDKVTRTVTLKHDAIGTLGVPSGTAEYPVKEAPQLEQIKVGDRVRFNAAIRGRSLLITHIAPAN
jgi:Cu/Ag efflux protein CusF